MRTFVRYDSDGKIVATVAVANLPRGREHPWVDLAKGEQAMEVTLPPEAGFNDLRQIHRGKVDMKTKQVVPLDKAGKGKAEKTRKAKAKAKPKKPPRPRVPPIKLPPAGGDPSAPPTGGTAGAATPPAGGTTGTVTPPIRPPAGFPAAPAPQPAPATPRTAPAAETPPPAEPEPVAETPPPDVTVPRRPIRKPLPLQIEEP